jgi:membrane fusion protein
MNADPNQSLFRKEALAHQAERLHGEVTVALPMSWQFIGYLLLAALAGALIFLAMASYSRVATVAGAVVLDKGVAPIVPSRRGVVMALLARDGQRVRAGDPLVQIRSEEDMGAGGTAPQRVIEALQEQDRRLADQTALVMSAAWAERQRLTAQIRGLTEEIKSLDNQIVDQQRLVAVAENDFRVVQGIAEKGYISHRELEAREAALIGRRQQLSQLRQARAGKSAEVLGASRSIPEAGATAQAQAAGVQSSRAGLAQQVAEAEAAKGYTLRSPVDGIVTAMVARLGQPAAQDQQLMSIMPAGGKPRVELYVPTSAAGFLALGQEVRLAVDAFPYQRFGTIDARISEISSAAIPRPGPDGGTVPVYLVTAELAQPWVSAFGRRQPLLPGMTLSARIVTEKQSLLEWLFEPILAVRRR